MKNICFLVFQSSKFVLYVLGCVRMCVCYFCSILLNFKLYYMFVQHSIKFEKLNPSICSILFSIWYISNFCMFHVIWNKYSTVLFCAIDFRIRRIHSSKKKNFGDYTKVVGMIRGECKNLAVQWMNKIRTRRRFKWFRMLQPMWILFRAFP